MNSIALSVATGVILGGLFTKCSSGASEDQIAAYYSNSVATLESTHGIRKKILEGKEDFILVDVRPKEQYIEEHIVGALNVPAYIDRESSEGSDAKRIIESFREIEIENPDKKVIIYCYSSSCMTGRKIGNLLAQNNIYVKEMTIGWNEWRYFYEQWNYPHEWENINPLDYVSNGSEPGEFQQPEGYIPEPCVIDNEFGC